MFKIILLWRLSFGSTLNPDILIHGVATSVATHISCPAHVTRMILQDGLKHNRLAWLVHGHDAFAGYADIQNPA